MELAAVYAALGEECSSRLIRKISIGATKTFGVYEEIKVRSRLRRLNRQALRTAAPRLWGRMANGDTHLAKDLSQGILVSNIPLVVAVLNDLGIEHDGSGFFDKDADYADQLVAGWPTRVLENHSEEHGRELVLLYINYLGWETESLDQPFLGDSKADGEGPEPADAQG